MEQVMQYIIELSPAITAVIGILVSLIVGIRKIKDHTGKVLNDVQETNRQILERHEQLVEDNAELRRENEELKLQMSRLLARLEHVHFVEPKR